MTGGLRSEQCTSRLARAAGVPPPPVVIVPGLHSRSREHDHGGGAAAITEASRSRVTIYIDQAAADSLPDPALDYVLAHELAHVVAWRRPTYRASLRIKELLMFGPAAVVALVVIVTIAAAGGLADSPPSVLIFVAAWPVLLVAGQMGRMAVQRREELAADRWAAHLLGSAAGLQAYAEWSEQDIRPRRQQHLGNWLLTATHPTYTARLAAMRQVASHGRVSRVRGRGAA